jgi:hypothetical protein
MSDRAALQDAVDRLVVNVGRMLAARYPEAVADVAIDETAGKVVARVLGHAQGRPRRELLIGSADAEATVSFGASHQHCYDPEYRDAAAIADQLIALVVAVVRGERVAYAAFAGDDGLGGGFTGAPIDLAKLRQRFPNADRFVISGWSHPDGTVRLDG